MLAYFDCFSGISGDMTLAAFVDLGVPVDWLQEKIAGIPLSSFEIVAGKVSRSGITARQIDVRTGAGGSRDYRQIKSLLKDSGLPENVRQTSLAIFKRIAVAEAGIHGCPVDHVHFHEVGGVDAIVDIVGTALCLEYLGIQRVTASRIPLGTGFVNARHGILPVPAPATLAILNGIPVYGTDTPWEMVTPTGAAIIATLAEEFGALPEMRLERIGYGAGHRENDGRPNLLRIVLGADDDGGAEGDRVCVLETCIDDMNPEIFGFLMERLFADGALDAYCIPIFMKKNRPATLVQVLCTPDRRDCLMHRILSETTSLGVRYRQASRVMLAREAVEVETRYGRIAAKRIRDIDGGVRIVPEYEVCRTIALERGIPLRTVYETVVRETAEG